MPVGPPGHRRRPESGPSETLKATLLWCTGGSIVRRWWSSDYNVGRTTTDPTAEAARCCAESVTVSASGAHKNAPRFCAVKIGLGTPNICQGGPEACLAPDRVACDLDAL